MTILIMSCEDGYLIKTDGSTKYNKDKTLKILFKGTAASGGTNTHISVNGGYGGNTLFCLVSIQWDTGNNTTSQLFMIRCGYNGNNYSVVKLHSSNEQSYYIISFSVNESGELIVSSSSSTAKIMIVGMK